MRGQPQNAAKNRSGKLRLPFINLLRVFKKLNVALDNLGKGNIAPAPECRRGRAGDAGDGGRLAFVLDGDFFPFGFGQRPAAREAIVLAGEQVALAPASGLRRFKFARDAFGQPADRPARPSVATEIFCCARSMVTASSAGSSASVSTTERARHRPASPPRPGCFSGDEFMPKSLLAYRRTRRDAKGTGEMQIWSVQTVRLLAISLFIIWHY